MYLLSDLHFDYTKNHIVVLEKNDRSIPTTKHEIYIDLCDINHLHHLSLHKSFVPREKQNNFGRNEKSLYSFFFPGFKF